MQVKQVQKKQRVTPKEFIRIQLQIWSTLHAIVLPTSILDLLVILALTGECEKSDFCRMLCKVKSSLGRETLFTSEQSSRNAVKQAIKLGLIISPHKAHTIKLAEELEILIEQGTL